MPREIYEALQLVSKEKGVYIEHLIQDVLSDYLKEELLGIISPATDTQKKALDYLKALYFIDTIEQ